MRNLTLFSLTVFSSTVFSLTPFVSAQAPDTTTLHPIVVTATRVPLPRDAVAASVTVITGAELRAQGVRTVAEALRTVSGAAVVQTGSFGGQTSLFLRGGESDYVKVLVDGVPWNQPGGAFDFADLTTDNVDRIEVVRGPASVLYGSDAMTGVIQILTRRGQGAPRLAAEARAGSRSTSEVAADVAGGGPRAGYALRASHFASDGIYRYNNDYRNTVVSGRLHLAPDARTAATLAYRWGDNVYHFPTDGAGEPVDSNQWSGDRGPAASLELVRALAPAVELRVLGTFREQRLESRDEPDSPGEDGSFRSRDLVRRASAGALVSWRAAPSAVLTAGVEYEDERQRGRSVFAASFGTFPDSMDAARWNRGYYLQALLGTTGPLGVQGGVRVEDNSQFGDHATFRLGVSYRLDLATRVRGSLGTGFKAPTFFENFARGSVRGDPNLEPERSRSWEVGVERSLAGGRLTVALTYFDQRFRDLIEFTFTPPPGAPNYFNVAGGAADGVEAELEATLRPGVVAGVRYTYLDTRVEEPGPDGGPDGLFVAGQRLLRRPAHALSPQVSASLGGQARVSLGARWVGERDDLDFRRPAGERRVTLRPYTRVRLAAEYDLWAPGAPRPGLVLTASVENLTDDDAPEIANFRSPGRTVLVGGRADLRF